MSHQHVFFFAENFPNVAVDYNYTNVPYTDMTDDYDSFKLISCKIFILMHSWLWLVSKQSGTEHGNCKFTWDSHIFTQLFMVYWWAAGITLKWIKITHTFVWFASCVAMNQAENIFLFRQHTHTSKCKPFNEWIENSSKREASQVRLGLTLH